jgi:ankyrin repeat protein
MSATLAAVTTTVGTRRNSTSLQIAAFRGYANIVKMLLANGADIKAVDKDGKTALQLAQDEHQTNVVVIFSETVK